MWEEVSKSGYEDFFYNKLFTVRYLNIQVRILELPLISQPNFRGHHRTEAASASFHDCRSNVPPYLGDGARALAPRAPPPYLIFARSWKTRGNLALIKLRPFLPSVCLPLVFSPVGPSLPHLCLGLPFLAADFDVDSGFKGFVCGDRLIRQPPQNTLKSGVRKCRNLLLKLED